MLVYECDIRMIILRFLFHDVFSFCSCIRKIPRVQGYSDGLESGLAGHSLRLIPSSPTFLVNVWREQMLVASSFSGGAGHNQVELLRCPNTV